MPLPNVFASVVVVAASSPGGMGSTEEFEALADLAALSLERLSETPVGVASNVQATLWNVASAVTVITADDILRCGCRSLADVLAGVPGFYDVYDLVWHNIGVRGLNGGRRAAGSIVKVMIDGQSVAFLPTTGNFFGPELVPIDAVERIEVLRGPASAMYGADAFLGAINVVLRKPRVDEASLGVGAGMQGLHPSFRGSASVSAVGRRVRVFAAASAARLDRSGHRLPRTAPTRAPPDEFARAPRVDPSARARQDIARPAALVASVQVGDALEHGALRLLTTVQRHEAHHWLHDVVPQSELTRTSLVNHRFRLSFDRDLGDLTLRLGGAYVNSATTKRDREAGELPDMALRRSSGSRGFELFAALGWVPLSGLELHVGVDVQRLRHKITSFERVFLEDVRNPAGVVTRRAGGSEPAGRNPVTKKTTNLGVSTEVSYTRPGGLRAIAGLRLDNHSLYDPQLSTRAGLVAAPPGQNYALKLLYGSSFKAPSVDQLYRHPARSTDIAGTLSASLFPQFQSVEKLRAQTSHTVEFVGGLRLGRWGSLQAGPYVMWVRGRVVPKRWGRFLAVMQNAQDETLAGVELEARFAWRRRWTSTVGATYVKSVSQRSEGYLILDRMAAETHQTAFPVVSGSAQLAYQVPVIDLWVAPMVRFASARNPSDANVRFAFRDYALAPYALLDLAISGTWHGPGDRRTTLRARAVNLLDARVAEPGFGGSFDVPILGRGGFANIEHHF